MKKLITTIFIFPLLANLSILANESFSVEIEALTLVMEKYKEKSNPEKENTFSTPSYMAFKQDECNAKVEVTEKKGLQVTALTEFDVNVCKKEILKIVNN